ncbi:MAG: hypothetical protein SH818_03305 [Saprospiraceae bacterium]|nr:hypothetical protein [Saprospiraceae bacterium]
MKKSTWRYLSWAYLFAVGYSTEASMRRNKFCGIHNLPGILITNQKYSTSPEYLDKD